eukprot:12598097-Alexandrium_andersonii.AAC.1
MRQRKVVGRVIVAQVVADRAGAWTPAAAVAAACAAWGSRAARALEHVEFIGKPCRLGEPPHTRPARVIAGMLR